jgi:paraquat-inducible protein B
MNRLPQIPLAPDSSADSIIKRINRVPIERIAQNLLSITQHIDALASSPELKHSIHELSATLDDMHHITSSAGPEVTRLITALRHTADNLDQVAQTTRQVVSGTAVQTGLESTMQEVTEAARSIRSLSDYLDRHPEALVQGRTAQQ